VVLSRRGTALDAARAMGAAQTIALGDDDTVGAE